MSGIPSQVEEAAELAEQLHKQMFNAEPEEIVENDDPSDEDDSHVEPDPEDIVEDDDLEEEAKFKQKYKSLKGKYDSEVPRLAKELRELKDEMFTRLLNATEAKQTAPAPTTEPATSEPDDLMSQFAETYGEDFTSNIQKLIALEAKKLTGTVEEKVNSLEDTQFKSAQNNFVNYLDDKLKDTKLDWKSCWQGDDPKFLEFLSKPDPSGLYTYGDLAKTYNEAWDADKLARIFEIYASESKPVTPTQPKAESPAKNAMVAPSRTNTHTAPDTSSKQIWTQDMIQEFQTNDRRGKYTAEESKAMWDDLLSALGENRIR